ncbi:hypothetical protein [Variovorax gossypii]
MNADRAQGLVASESLLRETLDYLMRLPVNPMTAQLARKIRTHLEDPAQAREVRDAALVINAAEQNRDLRSGVAWYTAAGLPALEVVVGAGCSVATISSPAARLYGGASAGKQFSKKLIDSLIAGQRVALGPHEPATAPTIRP